MSGRERGRRGGRADAVVVVWMQRAAGAAAEAAYGLGWHARSVARPASARRFRPGGEEFPTIVAVAGVFQRWDFLVPLLDGLNAVGYPVHVCEALGRNVSDVVELADVLFADLEASGVRDAIVLGHSKGGLVGKALLIRARSEQGDESGGTGSGGTGPAAAGLSAADGASSARRASVDSPDSGMPGAGDS